MRTIPARCPAISGARDWRIGPGDAKSRVSEGESIDLGGRALKVIHTPGHSPDSICLLDAAAGILFAGDTINTGPIYAHLPDSDLDQFTESATRLRMLGVSLHMVCVSHFGRAVVQPWILDEVADAFVQIKQGAVTLCASQDALNRPVTEVQFHNFSILLPPDSRAA